MITVEKALDILHERVVQDHRMLKQARRQRRTEYNDVYGLPFRSEIPELSKTNRFRLFIPTDKEYWERFQFKLFVSGAPDEGFDSDGFSMKIIEIDEDGQELPSVELKDYFEEQHGIWVDGNGYFPSEEISDEGADAEDFFDILDVTTLLMQEGETTSVKRILNAGTKEIKITAPVKCDVTFIPYFKHSSVNR